MWKKCKAKSNVPLHRMEMKRASWYMMKNINGQIYDCMFIHCRDSRKNIGAVIMTCKARIK